MDCKLKVEKPGKIVYTLTITMEADDWEALREQFGRERMAWPASTLAMNIDDLLSQARKIYWPSVAVSDADRS